MGSGVRLGCVLSPLLFNCVMDRNLKETMEMSGGGWNIEYISLGDCSSRLGTRHQQPLASGMYSMPMT